jgi:hypothetical protein
MFTSKFFKYHPYVNNNKTIVPASMSVFPPLPVGPPPLDAPRSVMFAPDFMMLAKVALSNSQQEYRKRARKHKALETRKLKKNEWSIHQKQLALERSKDPDYSHDDTEMEMESEDEAPLSTDKKRIRSTASDTEDATANHPDLRGFKSFGPTLRTTSAGFTIPFHQSSDVTDIQNSDALKEVTLQLQNDPLLSLIIWTILHRCFDTKNGRVGIFFATLYNSEDCYPVAVGHWSLWQRIMIQCYSVFTRGGIYKKDFKKSLDHLVCKDLSVDDILHLRAVSGATPMAASRVQREGHFVISAFWIRHAAKVLRRVETVFELLPSPGNPNAFCQNDHNGILTVRGLKQFENLQVSSFLMVKCQQSKFEALSHFGRRPDSVYLPVTPSFGVSWSLEQLDLLVGMRRFMSYRTESFVIQPSHCSTFYNLSDSAVETDTIIRARCDSQPGVEDDIKRRPETDHNFAQRRDLDDVELILDQHDISLPRPGRPSKYEKQKNQTKVKALEMVWKKRGRKSKKMSPFIVTNEGENEQKRLQELITLVKMQKSQEKPTLYDNPSSQLGFDKLHGLLAAQMI